MSAPNPTAPPLRSLVMDSHAMLVYLEGENGAEFVANALGMAEQGSLNCYMAIVNWGEVYFSLLRAKGEHRARDATNVLDQLPIEIVNMDMNLVERASRFREQFRTPNGLCFAASLAETHHCPVLTGDPLFRKLAEDVQILWLK
jgi:PIN domain nuclease of toxin-antitoxin system